MLTKPLEEHEDETDVDGNNTVAKPSVSLEPTTLIPDTASRHASTIMHVLFQREPITKKKRISSPKKPKNAHTHLSSLGTNTQPVRGSQHTHTKPSAVTSHTQHIENMLVEDMQTVPMLAKWMCFIMKRGHKAKAATCMKSVLTMLQELAPQSKKPVHALDMIQKAITHVKPAFELRKARFGGKTQFIPATLPVHKQENQALRAIVHTARMKQKKATFTSKHHDMYTFAYFLAQEINDAYKHQGAACQTKHSTHKQAENNRTHARRRWW
jgi:ribosomal protein S7